MQDRVIEIIEDILDAPDCCDPLKVACQLRDICVEDFLNGKSEQVLTAIKASGLYANLNNGQQL